MLNSRIELRVITTLVPKAGQFGVCRIGDLSQHFERQQPVFPLRVQPSGEIENMVVGRIDVAIDEGESDQRPGRPARAAIIRFNIFDGRHTGDFS